jgi:hypothetical protein
MCNCGAYAGRFIEPQRPSIFLRDVYAIVDATFKQSSDNVACMQVRRGGQMTTRTRFNNLKANCPCRVHRDQCHGFAVGATLRL